MTKTNVHPAIVRVERETELGGPEFSCITVEVNGYDFECRVFTSDEKEAVAAGNKIAAAPALLEALEATMLYLPEGEIRRNARAALKLAKVPE